MTISKLGQRIEAFRTRRGLTQRELARQAGIGHTIVAGLESGSRQDVRTDTAKRIARALGTSIDHLVGTFDDDDEDEVSATYGLTSGRGALSACRAGPATATLRG